MFEVKHFRIQYGVGQGSFHAGYIDAEISSNKPAKRINYVYDCGAANIGRITKQLKQSIDHYTRSLADLPVDFLAISHFDADHINGAELLCKKNQVKRIFLPYLIKSYALFLVAQSLSQGIKDVELTSYAATLGEIVVNNSAWGVPTTLIRGGERNNNQQTDTDIQPPEDSEVQLIFESPNGTRSPPNDVVDDNEELVAVFHGQKLWRFKFWNYHQTDALSLSLSTALINELHKRGIISSPQFNITKTADLKDLVSEILKDKSKKKDTIDAYASAIASITKDGDTKGLPNRISLCLLSAPPMTSICTYSRSMDASFWNRRYSQLGWIGTGDAPLGEQALLQDFLNHYKADIGTIDTLVVPHHGAAPKNPPSFFDSKLLGSATWAVISVGANNSYGHPKPSVLHEIMENGVSPVVVTEFTRPGFFQIGIAIIPYER